MVSGPESISPNLFAAKLNVLLVLVLLDCVCNGFADSLWDPSQYVMTIVFCGVPIALQLLMLILFFMLLWNTFLLRYGLLLELWGELRAVVAFSLLRFAISLAARVPRILAALAGGSREEHWANPMNQAAFCANNIVSVIYCSWLLRRSYALADVRFYKPQPGFTDRIPGNLSNLRGGKMGAALRGWTGAFAVVAARQACCSVKARTPDMSWNAALEDQVRISKHHGSMSRGELYQKSFAWVIILLLGAALEAEVSGSMRNAPEAGLAEPTLIATAAHARWRRRPRARRQSAGDGEQEASWHARYAAPVKLTRRYCPQRFAVGDARAQEHLRREGYVILADVLTPDQVAEATERFWSYLSASTAGAVQRDSPLTWQSHLWPGQDYNGLINSGGIGQSDFMWYIRSKPKVIAAFADVWGVDKEDLIMSFDGCCAFRPPSVDPRWRTRAGWFHTDQNGRTTGSEFVCAQGLVALTDGDESTGGLAVLPGSHRSHAEIFRRWPLERENDFFILPRSDELLAERSPCKPHVVPVNAGDLVLWDSRLIHCNVPAVHRFDEAPLDAALLELGLGEAAEKLLPELTSVADAAWTWALHEATFDDILSSWGLSSPSLREDVAKQCAVWAKQISEELNCDSSVPKLTRLVAYVCATPRSSASEGTLRLRQAAAVLGATTSHWPDRCAITDAPLNRAGLVDFRALDPLAFRLIGCASHTRDEAFAELTSVLRHLQTRADPGEATSLSALAEQLR
ncbi:unnamed protein product [Symbiodinium natans]|uniref:Uncharacterized protein n=1 Tax=Symbiodinium natans TaxID=878477 RepID=A0A812U0P1_9DINO|nr:unnamed protein product [Symbiodinium natans]